MPHSNRTCAASLREIAGKYLNPDEIEAFILEHQNMVRHLQNKDKLLSVDKAEAKAAEEMITRLERLTAERKRNAAVSLKKRLEAVDYIITNYKDNPIEGFNAFLAGAGGDILAFARGSQGYVQGSLKSIGSEITGQQNKALGMVLADLEQEGLTGVFNTGKLNKEILIQLYELKNKGKPGKSGSEVAQKIAQIMKTNQEYWRQAANLYGASINELEGYAVLQTHDYFRLKPKPGETKTQARNRWILDIKPLLDPEATFNGASPDEFLTEMYDGLLSGVHLSYENPLSRFYGNASVSKRISAPRTLHFKDGEAFFKYNQKYGTGILNENYISGLHRLATNTALMKRLGTNPRHNLKEIYTNLKIISSRTNNVKAIEQFREGVNGMPDSSHSLIASLLGDTEIPGNNQLAQLAAIIRAWESMSMLGMSMITSFTDLPLQITNAVFQGRGVKGGLGDIVNAFTKVTDPEEKRLLSMLGVVSDNLPGLLAERHGLDDGLSGKMARAMHLFFNLSGVQWWTDNLRKSGTLGFISYLGGHAKDGTKFADFTFETRQLLEAYGFFEKDWEFLKGVQLDTIRENTYLTMDRLKEVSDEKFAAYLGITLETPNYTKKLIMGKEELFDRYRNMITDLGNKGVLHPSFHERALIRRGTQKGTTTGEALRFFGQFKSFPISIVNNALNRLIFMKGGSKNIIDGIGKGTTDTIGLINTMLAMTVMGYMSMTIKDYLKGRNPRSLSPETITAALVQGGALGIYGDLLFNDASKYGQNYLSGLGGPGFNLVNDLVATATAGEDILPTATRRLDRHIPFSNLFYTKTFVDFMLIHRLNEWVNPGYLRRMEKQIEADTGQTFWLQPSEAVR